MTNTVRRVAFIAAVMLATGCGGTVPPAAPDRVTAQPVPAAGFPPVTASALVFVFRDSPLAYPSVWTVIDLRDAEHLTG